MIDIAELEAVLATHKTNPSNGLQTISYIKEDWVDRALMDIPKTRHTIVYFVDILGKIIRCNKASDLYDMDHMYFYLCYRFSPDNDDDDRGLQKWLLRVGFHTFYQHCLQKAYDDVVVSDGYGVDALVKRAQRNHYETMAFRVLDILYNPDKYEGVKKDA